MAIGALIAEAAGVDMRAVSACRQCIVHRSGSPGTEVAVTARTFGAVGLVGVVVP